MCVDTGTRSSSWLPASFFLSHLLGFSAASLAEKFSLQETPPHASCVRRFLHACGLILAGSAMTGTLDGFAAYGQEAGYGGAVAIGQEQPEEQWRDGGDC